MKAPFIFTLVMSIFLLIYLINDTGNYGMNVKPAEAASSKSNFEVVDTYNGCDVVRYTPDNSARYSYFLDCKK